MTTCKRPAAVLDGGAGHATQGSSACCKRRRISMGSTADYEETSYSYLGDGGFGFVVKARHRVTGKKVAMKFLCSTGKLADIDNLLREARFLKACNGNPYVVGFDGLVRGPTTGHLGLAMEYVGQSLKDFLREKRCGQPALPEATVRAFMWQLLTGAKKMHERHIIHRDIKPSNILVTEDEKIVKICDLGLAMSMSEPMPYSKAGTVTYMAPEMLLGKTDYDVLVDTWSLGCVMAELLTGKALFTWNNANEIRQLWTIFSVLGISDDKSWPGFMSLPLTASVPAGVLLQGQQRSRLREMFPEETLSSDGFRVLEGLLACNPDKRLTAAAALRLPWFAPHRPAAAATIDAMAHPEKELRIKTMPPAIPKKKSLLEIPPERRNTQRM